MYQNPFCTTIKPPCARRSLIQTQYPFPPCLSSQYVSTIGQQDGSSDGWLSQFLALRDISHFVVGAFLQQATERGSNEVLIPLQSSSASIRSAILQALDNVQLPSHLSRLDMIDTFSETFGTILPDTPSLVLRDSVIFQAVDHEIDAMDALCARLNERELAGRLSDHEVMYGISDVTRTVALLDDPNGHFMGPTPRIYASNCRKCHFVGHSQLRRMKGMEFPVRVLLLKILPIFLLYRSNDLLFNHIISCMVENKLLELTDIIIA